MSRSTEGRLKTKTYLIFLFPDLNELWKLLSSALLSTVDGDGDHVGPVIVAGSVGLPDIEHLHLVVALIGDGTDRSATGDVRAVTVAGSLSSDCQNVWGMSDILLWWCPHRRWWPRCMEESFRRASVSWPGTRPSSRCPCCRDSFLLLQSWQCSPPGWNLRCLLPIRVEHSHWSRLSRYFALIGWTLLYWRQCLNHNNTLQGMLPTGQFCAFRCVVMAW